jgi:hypothetical protein
MTHESYKGTRKHHVVKRDVPTVREFDNPESNLNVKGNKANVWTSDLRLSVVSVDLCLFVNR